MYINVQILNKIILLSRISIGGNKTLGKREGEGGREREREKQTERDRQGEVTINPCMPRTYQDIFLITKYLLVIT